MQQARGGRVVHRHLSPYCCWKGMGLSLANKRTEFQEIPCLFNRKPYYMQLSFARGEIPAGVLTVCARGEREESQKLIVLTANFGRSSRSTSFCPGPFSQRRLISPLVFMRARGAKWLNNVAASCRSARSPQGWSRRCLEVGFVTRYIRGDASRLSASEQQPRAMIVYFARCILDVRRF